MTTNITNKQAWDNFLRRDKEAVNDLNNHWMHGPITESRRLQFVEGRLEDICIVVGQLIKNLEQNKDDCK